jgi:4a-hydroxytetrahydrobiopterin dehydratase
MPTLTPSERDKALATLPGWHFDTEVNAIKRDFAFADFSRAFAFMTRVALAAEKAGHHPDWSNSYAEVMIALSTHSDGGVTQKDIALAKAINELAG